MHMWRNAHKSFTHSIIMEKKKRKKKKTHGARYDQEFCKRLNTVEFPFFFFFDKYYQIEVTEEKKFFDRFCRFINHPVLIP